MKKFVLGFLLGALLFSIVPVSAAIEEYILYKSEAKLIVDGQEYNNPDLPILNYKGYNYIPAATFRDICKAIGVDFQWVGEVKQIQLKTNKAQTSFSDKSEVDKMSMTSDGIKILKVNGDEYVSLIDICNKYRKYSYGLSKNGPSKNEIRNNASKSPLFMMIYDENEEIFIDNIPGIFHNGLSCVTVEYYENSIFPLIKGDED